jgi:rhodanese-related sulfurtransferase
MSLPTISPTEAKRLIDKGAKLIDIRGPDEHARERIPGAENHPIEGLSALDGGSGIAIFHCRSGQRTAANADKLARAASCDAYIVEGGIEAWKVGAGDTPNCDCRPEAVGKQTEAECRQPAQCRSCEEDQTRIHSVGQRCQQRYRQHVPDRERARHQSSFTRAEVPLRDEMLGHDGGHHNMRQQVSYLTDAHRSHESAPI